MRSAILLSLCVLAACKQPEMTIPPGQQTIPNTVWIPTPERELNHIYNTRTDRKLPPGAQLHGFTGRLPDGTYVIYSPMPKRVDDQATCTLGHEVLHVLYGQYHANSIP